MHPYGPARALPQHVVPRVVFVLGKGGVGRSTVAAALGAGLAATGKRVIVAQWAVVDAISPWFGRARAGYAPADLAPGLATMNYSSEAALEQYFVTHLGMRALFHAVIANRHVRAATRAAPGLEELVFLGMVFWLVTLAARDTGRCFDHAIVDAPAMGHGASLLGVPSLTRTLGLGGLLAGECERVASMLADPTCAGAVVVTTPDELALDETREFWPRIERELGRPPLAAIVNRSARALGELPPDPGACAWFEELAASDDDDARAGLDRVYAHLARRIARERAFTSDAPLGTLAIDDALLVADEVSPRGVVALAQTALVPLWSPR